MNNDIAISVQNVSKFYKMYGSPRDRFKEFLHPGKKTYHHKFWALRDISFNIERGTTFGIIGQNGGGKSTLLQLISGIIRPTHGSVTVNGRVSALLELGTGFHRDFSGHENVFMQGALMGISREEMESNFESIQRFADIGEFIDQPVKTYSSGMYVRLAFATAVNVNPDILIIDEVLAVGDDMFRRRCFSKLEDFSEQGKTILFVSHDIETVTSICNRAILIDLGQLIQIGTPKDITNTYSKLITQREEEYLKNINRKTHLGTTLKENAPETNNNTDQETQSEFRYGAGGAELLDITLMNLNKERVNIIEQGDTYTISIKVQFMKTMNNPGIGFKIRTITGVDVCGTNTFLNNCNIGNVNEGTVAQIDFTQEMILNPGSYALTSGVVADKSTQAVFQDRRMDVLVFKVVGNAVSTGLVDTNSKVEISIENKNS